MRLESKRDGSRGLVQRLFWMAVVGVWAVMLGAGAPAMAGDVVLLKDLERERAALLGALLDPDRTAEERERYVRATARRLADMERILLRDDALLGDTSPLVRRAFADYDLTFLAHAAAEQDRSMLDLWLDKIGLDTDVVMNARPGRRP